MAGQILHGLAPLVDGLTKGDIAADGRGVTGFQDQDLEAAFFQRVDRSGGQIAAAPDDDEMFHSLLQNDVGFFPFGHIADDGRIGDGLLQMGEAGLRLVLRQGEEQSAAGLGIVEDILHGP